MNFFPEIDFEKVNFSSLGYYSFSVSIFDHWLSENEFVECNTLCFSSAKKNGFLADYLEGENKFLSFYKYLTHSSVLSYQGNNILSFEKYNDNLEEIIINSLREKSLMDLFFLEMDLRVIGGYDRTDLFLLRDRSKLDGLKKIVNAHGLFVLEH